MVSSGEWKTSGLNPSGSKFFTSYFGSAVCVEAVGLAGDLQVLAEGQKRSASGRQ